MLTPLVDELLLMCSRWWSKVNWGGLRTVSRWLEDLVAGATHWVQRLDPVIVKLVGVVGCNLILECGVDFEWQILAAHATGTTSTAASTRHVVCVWKLLFS